MMCDEKLCPRKASMGIRTTKKGAYTVRYFCQDHGPDRGEPPQTPVAIPEGKCKECGAPIEDCECG